ncbi:AAA family ATPase [Pseudorhizobium flavum]|uniref:DNA polymerase III delta prime subunit n=1 Tax=Pseudorhizobium flavum TaxID=1335061 RepID=A0A7X0DBN8_9HYPH|nr:AAA family ATPase [Pseudorhizobium flavum]MBB6178086.1 DNA polymerase III delta prime subunit [Pseudorhizobium flavum]CAD6615009.1 ATP-dependent Zn protease [Pseudorhizobium flavum]
MKSDPDQELLDEAIQRLMDATSNLRTVISRSSGTLNSRSAPIALAASPRKFLAFCGFVRLMRQQKNFFADATSVLVVTVPRDWPIDDLDYVADVCLKSGERGLSKLKTFCHPPRTKKGGWDFNPSSYLDAQKVIVFLPRGAEMHPEFEISADAVIDLEILDDRHLDSLTRQLHTGPLSEDEKERLRQQDPAFINSIFRKGRSAAAALTKLERLLTKPARGPKLIPLASYGEAGQWGIKFKSDLRLWRTGQLAWSDMDRGILLYGPPGSGKTSFAASLASECGAHLVPSSLAKWQSTGHLGDLLKAMRQDFAEARDRAPSILLIDEIDSVGDRRSFSGDNKHYCTEVVNGLLEALDGVAGSEGVVVVASTNFPEAIDPAILRSGRLETHVEMKRPNTLERAQILHFYLPALGAPQEFTEIARHLNGKTGSDLERLVRKAKQRARSENRKLTFEDVWAVVPKQTPLSDEDRWRVCIHEAAHVVMTELSRSGSVTGVEVLDDVHDYVEAHNALGRTSSDCSLPALRTEEWFRQDIAISLAGMAGEELVFNNRSTTAGGSRGSDLTSATDSAALMVARFGLGKRLSVFPDEVDRPVYEVFGSSPKLRADVDFILAAEYLRTKRLLEANLKVLIALAHALKRERRLEGERLKALLRDLFATDGATERLEFTG